MSGLFRCAGDILFDDHEPMPGSISNVQLKKFSETSNFLQYKKPLTPEHPYFFAQIRALASQKSKITLGIAGPDIDNDAHPGHWNNTVGYHSDTGKCFSSHQHTANTKGEQFSIGAMFGVYVTYFGDKMSTVMFLKNGVPVATRYLYEKDHSKYLPTICLEHGPIDLGIMWPEAAMGVPVFVESNMLHWIRDISVSFDMGQNVFKFDQASPSGLIQSPRPLTKDMVHYEVIVGDNEDGESPAVGIATCSPLKPTPTCVLLRDFFRWKADGKSLKCTKGQRIGFGIHYNPELQDKPDFNDKAEQLVLCFVTLDMQIVFFRMMIQPAGGFYPLVALTPGASSISLDVETNRDLGDDSTRELLNKLYNEKVVEAQGVILADRQQRELLPSMFRQNGSIDILPDVYACELRLSKEKKRIHTVQFLQTLNPDHPYFYLEIVKLNEDSVISIGVGDDTFPLNKHPGKYTPSTGYVSKDGKMYFDERCTGNIEGKRFGEGDTIGLEVKTFNPDGLSVILFYKNDLPVGTRFVSIKNTAHLFPTVSLCGNGYDVELQVYWQNRISQAPELFINRVDNWCIPSGSVVDVDNSTITIDSHSKPVTVQCPYNLDELFNHFEIQLVTDFGNGIPPPIVALSSAGAQEPHAQTSNFRLDCLRFWATGEAEKSVCVGDTVGWGMLIPDSEFDKEDRMVMCYLTINRNIALTRVLFEPPGGLYPIIILPAEVNKVKFDLSALRITSHPLTEEVVDHLLDEAKEIYAKEQELIQSGKDIEELDIHPSSLLKPLSDSMESTSPNSTDKPNSTSPKLHSVFKQAKAMDDVQKAFTAYRNQGQNSKACVIL